MSEERGYTIDEAVGFDDETEAAAGAADGQDDSDRAAAELEAKIESTINDPKSDFDAIKTKANRYFFTKVVINAILVILGAVLIALFLRNMQGKAALAKQRVDNEQALNDAITILKVNDQDAADLTTVFHDANQDMLDDLSELFRSGLFDGLTTADDAARAEVFSDVVSRSGVEYLFAVNTFGDILISPYAEYTGQNLESLGLMSSGNLFHLISGTRRLDKRVQPILEKNSYGSFYFYSQPFTYNGYTFLLVLGCDSSALDTQIASLTDVSVVLSRCAVGNDGFLFAVDTTDSTFLYYDNGGEVLTGMNALEAGLSAEALKDGYAGIETINGTRYYCVSRKFGSSTVICAAADTSVIMANDRYVLFWSITGFVLVMLLCLIYAVIVRNDFVRNATKTVKKVIYNRRGNRVIFDISIFKKIFPLMLAGILLIFCISFYTQTLLEISQSISDSTAALDEVAGRYAESVTSRETIKTYYDNRFLAKAKLLAYILEEDPEVLNTPTSRYHSTYDENGNRLFIRDDEGNILRSVSSSARLQEFCDTNELESVYVFDEDGRVIATNTPNWYFSVSHDPEAQSYEFLKVLDGRVDVLIQESMTNDLGEAAQYIGVAFSYYTALDEDGETVYMSRYDYEQYLDTQHGATSEYDEYGEPVRAYTEIHPHRSMVQIGLKQELSEMLLASTDLDYVFSTDMLSGGFIVLFDGSEDHVCLYSPMEARIGMKAADIGLSDNAFAGTDYYGFTQVGGVRYFQYFRYSDGYYIATAIPRDAMYQARLPIALITAITSLILILILSATITVTTEEEEMLYATMSDAKVDKGLDSTIFNVILPSGSSVSTVKAAARWDNSRVPWREKSPEQKLLFMISIVFGILVIYVIATVATARSAFDDDSIIQYILSGGWDRSPNIFALSACMLVLIFTGIAVMFFRVPVRLITSILGARGETIGHLLVSIVKYGGAIGAVFFCLHLVGVDSTSLLASAGVLTLVVGLGAQSLIKDIIAGIFIVFEGEFRVGDIVTINDFRGTVMDIGLRTTKILNVDGNIKIYNNSEISGVLNMTKEASYSYVTISVEYGQDIDYVEAVLARELPALKDMNPQILSAPQSLGVKELGPSGIDILIYCMCNEADVKSVTRFVNKEVLKIFYRNGINVPFPNVTVSNLDMTGRKTMADLEKEEKEN